MYYHAGVVRDEDTILSNDCLLDQIWVYTPFQ